MRRILAMSASLLAFAIVPTATAGGPTPIEVKLGQAADAIVVCNENPPGWASLTIAANRPVVSLWATWCDSLDRSLTGQKALDAGVVQGWYALATQQGKVACWHRIHRYDACEAGEAVAAATAASRVPQLMRAAGATKGKYIAKVAKAVQAMINQGS